MSIVMLPGETCATCRGIRRDHYEVYDGKGTCYVVCHACREAWKSNRPGFDEWKLDPKMTVEDQDAVAWGALVASLGKETP